MTKSGRQNLYEVFWSLESRGLLGPNCDPRGEFSRAAYLAQLDLFEQDDLATEAVVHVEGD